MSDEKKEKKMFKRLPAPVVIGLRKLRDEVSKLNEEYSNWARDKAEELGYYVDQVNFDTGMIFDPLSRPDAPDRKIIARLSLQGPEKKVMEEARAKIKKMNEASRVFTRRLQDTSLKFGLPARSLNLDNGEVTEDIEVVTLQPLDEAEKNSPPEVEKTLQLDKADLTVGSH